MRYAAACAVLAALAIALPCRADGGALGALRAGVAARDAGHWGEALADFHEAVADSPSWGLANLELAGALLRTGGDLGAVAAHLATARKADPDNPRLAYLTGLLAEAENHPKQAVAAYGAAVQRRPSLVEAQLRLGTVLLQLGHPAAAIPHLKAAIQGGGRAMAARANLADAYERTGDLHEAEAELKTLVVLFPHNAFELTRLARFYQRHGRKREAKRILRRADALAGRHHRRMRPLPRSRR